MRSTRPMALEVKKEIVRRINAGQPHAGIAKDLHISLRTLYRVKAMGSDEDVAATVAPITIRTDGKCSGDRACVFPAGPSGFCRLHAIDRVADHSLSPSTMAETMMMGSEARNAHGF